MYSTFKLSAQINNIPMMSCTSLLVCSLSFSSFAFFYYYYDHFHNYFTCIDLMKLINLYRLVILIICYPTVFHQIKCKKFFLIILLPAVHTCLLAF